MVVTVLLVKLNLFVLVKLNLFVSVISYRSLSIYSVYIGLCVCVFWF